MFLSCGDSLFDVFAGSSGSGDASLVEMTARVGGSPLNVALGLARLGHPSAFLSKVSGDLFGRQIRRFMQSEGIDERFLVPTERATTLAMISLGEDRSPRYDFYIEGTADRSLRTEELPSALPGVRVIHIGSYSTVAEPTAGALEALVLREKDRLFVSYDPNIRASVVPDLDVWRSRVARLSSMASLVKASEEDLALLFPGRPIEDTLADWIAAGALLAVATRGEKGAVALSAGGLRVEVPGERIEVVDTVGAGDTFQASLIAFLAENDQLEPLALRSLDEADLAALLAFAVRAAALTCTRRGADLPRRADLGLPSLAR